MCNSWRAFMCACLRDFVRWISASGSALFSCMKLFIHTAPNLTQLCFSDGIAGGIGQMNAQV